MSTETVIQALLALHTPQAIYDGCGHPHAEADPDEGVVEVYDVGLVCAEGLVYYICASCCRDDIYQTEDCAMNHEHDRSGSRLCPTRDILDADEATQ